MPQFFYSRELWHNLSPLNLDSHWQRWDHIGKTQLYPVQANQQGSICSTRVDKNIARDVKHWKDWEKHDKYMFAEQPLPRIANVSGYHLGGRLIDLDIYEPKPKYMKRCDLEVKAPIQDLC